MTERKDNSDKRMKEKSRNIDLNFVCMPPMMDRHPVPVMVQS